MNKAPSNIQRLPTFSDLTTRSMVKIGKLGTQLMGQDDPAFQLREMAPPTPMPARFQPAVLQVSEQSTIGPVANIVRDRSASFFSGNQPRLMP